MWGKVNAKELMKNGFLYFLLVIVLTIAISSKIDFHVDELLTYNLANDNSWFEPENGITYMPADQAFVDAMSSNGTFELGHVWEQQKNDVHPPLYYILISKGRNSVDEMNYKALIEHKDFDDKFFNRCFGDNNEF